MAVDKVENTDIFGMPRAIGTLAAPPAHATWPLEGDRGTAWVYYANENEKVLKKPVILSDGFHHGATKLDDLYDGLNGKKYPFITNLRAAGHDVIILGYKDCTASMLENAVVARKCIDEAIRLRVGTAPLAVGGFSMGGLITRYTLAKMETDGVPHHTKTYVCYDSPHHGAWMPVGLQALAYALTSLPPLAEQVQSDAARQLLWRHVDGLTSPATVDPLRPAFFNALKLLGANRDGWPGATGLKRIGVANGKGHGVNGVPAGQVALSCSRGSLAQTELLTQNVGERVKVARIKSTSQELDHTVYTSNLPAVDGAHGGTLETVGLVKDLLAFLYGATAPHPKGCFVPTASAIAVSGMAEPFDHLGTDVRQHASHLHAFKCSTDDTLHTEMTEELGAWIIAELNRAIR